MKKSFLIFIVVLVSISIFSQAPMSFSYQAILRNTYGTIRVNETVSVQIKILQGSIDGSSAYMETHEVTTNNTGLITLQIGSGTTSDSLSIIDWEQGPYFLDVSVNGTHLGASQLLSVPYALHSKTADTVTGKINESDPAYSASEAANITSGDISNWNLKQDELSVGTGISIFENTISATTGTNSIALYTASEIAALSPSAGDAVYNITDNLYQIYDGLKWNSFPAACWPQPTTAFAGSDSIFDDGTLSLSLAANTPEANHGMGQWSVLSGEGGVFSDAANPTTTFTGQALTTYELQWTITTTCGASTDAVFVEFGQTTTNTEANFVVLTNLPGQESTVAVETDLIFVGEQVEFYNSSVGGESYLWDFDDGNTSELESPEYSYDSPGTYTVMLNASGQGSELDTISKTIEVLEGVNSALRITVLEYYDKYPVEGASVILYGSESDWMDQSNPSEEHFTTALGKCVFEGLNNQHYYVDVWEEDHDNYTLAAEDVSFIETQALEPGFIHDFFAYVDYYESGKKVVLTRIGKKEWAKENVSKKNPSEIRKSRPHTFSQKR